MRRIIRKFAQNKQENKQTNKQTNKQRFQIQRPLLSPVDRRGERANYHQWTGLEVVGAYMPISMCTI